MHFRAAIIETRRNKRQTWKDIYKLLLICQSDSLAEISLQYEELKKREDEDDVIISLYFMVGC